jgi:hypothetical protein
VHELRHALALALDHPQRVRLLLAGVRAPQEVLGVADDRGDRRPQLVAGVGGEAALGLERLLQPVEHVVDRQRQRAQLVVGRRHRHAALQVLARHLGGRLGHALHRGQHLARQPPHAERERQERHQHGQAEVAGELVEGRLDVRGRDARRGSRP